MKRFFLLCVLLAVICVPAIVLGETWAEFVDRAHEAMEGAKGEVVVEVTGKVTVANYKQDDWAYSFVEAAKDTPLIVPKGVQLVIEGENTRFDGMLFGGGDVSLRGKALSVGPFALYLNKDSKNPFQAKLAIGEGTTIRGISSHEYGDGFNLQTAVEIEIYNYGEINDEQNYLHSSSIDVSTERGGITAALYNYGNIEQCEMRFKPFSRGVAGGAIRLTIHNEGTIRFASNRGNGGEWRLALNSGRNGVQVLHLTNSGFISTEKGIFISIGSAGKNKSELSIENLEGGVIECTEKRKAAVRFEKTSGGSYAKGLFSINNAGTLRAAGLLLDIDIDTDFQVPFSLVNTGVAESADPGNSPIILTITQTLRNIRTQKDFEKQIDKLIDKIGFDFLPVDATMQLLLKGTVGKEEISETRMIEHPDVQAPTTE